MKCLSCDCVLTDREAVRKFELSKTYIDLCDDCLSYISDEVKWIDNPLASNSLDVHDELNE